MIRIPELSKARRLLGVAAVAASAMSCARMGNTLIYGREAAAAKDQIMLVRKDPPSFGYQRLQTQASVFPDLEFFLSKRGIPDFLAETGIQGRKYFILYYLSQRKAFVCRNRVEDTKAVEFSGPNPITDREYRLLDGFRKDPTHKPNKL